MTIIKSDRLEPLEVLIAGGGVAGLEALLALRSLAGPRVRVTLLAPDPEFVYRPLTVGEPFGLTRPRRLDLKRIVADSEARHRADSLAGVDLARRVVRTSGGEELRFGALIVAVGTGTSEALPGALTFGGSRSSESMRRLLDELAEGSVTKVAFALPVGSRWPLPLYELALLTAKEMRAQGVTDAGITLVTPEARPLEVFAGEPSEQVGGMLVEAGVEVICSSSAQAVLPGQLRLADGRSIPADRVVTLPRLHVPDLPGIPQGANGFIPTDPLQRIEGMSDVYAAGDATWFPIKHGGIAAQQADTAAETIAAGVGVDVDPSPARLVLRGALLTAQATRYLQAELGDPAAPSTTATGALWWPPGKIAGRYLAPYLALHFGDEGQRDTLSDLSAAHAADPEGSDAAHAEALSFALAGADADARWGDYGGALRWLDVAEQLNVALPPEYAARREEWDRDARASGR